MSTIEGTGSASVVATAPAATRESGLPIGRLAAVVLWLCVGHGVLGGLYWLLLNVPESNVLMLIGSALLAIVLVIGAGVVDTTALLWLRPDWPLGRAMRRSLRVLPVFLLALAVWLLIAWVCAAFRAYYVNHSGELDAWLIAKFDWTRNAWLHRLIEYVIDVLQFVIGTSLAVSLLTIGAAESVVDVVRLRWIPRGLHWLQLVVVAVAMYGLVWLPWQAVYWRPSSLPATSMQVVFAIAKLLAIGVLMHVGWALVLWAPQFRRQLRS
jgi:hypothetical protein